MSNDANGRSQTRRHASIFQENRRVPSLRTHKASGQAYVVLNGKAIYLGRPDDPLTARPDGPLHQHGKPLWFALTERHHSGLQFRRTVVCVSPQGIPEGSDMP